MPAILFVSSYSGMGGGETATLTLAAHLPAEVTPHLVVPRAGAFAEAWRARGWPVHVMPFRGASTWFVPHLWAHMPPRRDLVRLMRREQFALVHAEYHALPMAWGAANAVGVPLVWTVMGWWFRPKRWQRDFFRALPLTFAHSQAIAEGFLGTPPFMPPERVRVLYPSVDTARFHPEADGGPVREALHIPADAPLVMMAGRYQDVKGHDVFVQMAEHVAQRHPRAHFLIVGGNAQTPADRAYQDGVRGTIERSAIASRVHLSGHRDDMPNVFAAADVVVCPSRFESFGVVNVEAMASGKPVVSTNNGGPREVVVDGVSGYLVPPDDAAALAERVGELLHSAAQRASMGAAGRLRAVQVFGAEAAGAAFWSAVRGG